jgi:hypothetical protein
VTPAEVDDMIQLADINSDGFVNIDGAFNLTLIMQTAHKKLRIC